MWNEITDSPDCRPRDGDLVVVVSAFGYPPISVGRYRNGQVSGLMNYLQKGDMWCEVPPLPNRISSRVP
jgi:hypothetical protein